MSVNLIDAAKVARERPRTYTCTVWCDDTVFSLCPRHRQLSSMILSALWDANIGLNYDDATYVVTLKRYELGSQKQEL